MFNSSNKSDFNLNLKSYFHCSRRLLHSRQKIGLIKNENSRTPKRNESNTIIKRLNFRRKLHKNIQILKTMPLIEYFCTTDDDFYWKCYSCLLYWLLFTFPLMKIAKETVGYRAIYLISFFTIMLSTRSTRKSFLSCENIINQNQRQLELIRDSSSNATKLKTNKKRKKEKRKYFYKPNEEIKEHKSAIEIETFEITNNNDETTNQNQPLSNQGKSNFFI